MSEFKSFIRVVGHIRCPDPSAIAGIAVDLPTGSVAWQRGFQIPGDTEAVVNFSGRFEVEGRVEDQDGKFIKNSLTDTMADLANKLGPWAKGMGVIDGMANITSFAGHTLLWWSSTQDDFANVAAFSPSGRMVDLDDLDPAPGSPAAREVPEFLSQLAEAFGIPADQLKHVKIVSGTLDDDDDSDSQYATVGAACKNEDGVHGHIAEIREVSGSKIARFVPDDTSAEQWLRVRDLEPL